MKNARQTYKAQQSALREAARRKRFREDFKDADFGELLREFPRTDASPSVVKREKASQQARETSSFPSWVN
jgi:hypothetical protein